MNTNRAILHTDACDVDRRLNDLGLTRDLLLRAEAEGCLDYQNAPFGGIDGNANYRAADRALSVLIAQSQGIFSRQSHLNIPVAMNGTGTFAIAVTTGDHNCGINGDTDPETKTVKGPNMKRAIKQRLKFSADSDDLGVDLCVLLSAWQSDAAFELSFPMTPDADGRIRGWRERFIIAKGGSGRPVRVEEAPPEQPIVRRRSA